MDTAKAFALGEASHDQEPKVFDWHKAARRIAEEKPKHAAAGLSSDWEYTGGTIFKNGRVIIDDYTYLSSTWATPELEMDGCLEPCWVMKSEQPDWNADTKWPDSAREIYEELTGYSLGYSE